MVKDRAAFVVGSIRMASGISFLIDPLRANRWWGERDDPGPSARLLLRSMGYRDALIGDCCCMRRRGGAIPAAGFWPPAVPMRPTCWAG